MRIVVGQRSRPSEGRSYRVMDALAKAAMGHVIDREKHPGLWKPDYMYLQWGYRLTPALQHTMDRGYPFAIIDLGYFNDRNKCLSVSINGFHGKSMPLIELPKAERRKPTLMDWRDEGGEYVYIYGQLPGDRSLRGPINPQVWMTRTAQEASQRFNLPAKIRPHPKTGGNWQAIEATLPRTFEETHVAVTWTSTAAVQAAIAGIPVCAMHPASPASDIASPTFERITPNREYWLHKLSWRNYRYNELNEVVKYLELAYPQAQVMAEVGHYDTEGLRP